MKKVHFANAQHVLVIKSKLEFECAVNTLVATGINFELPGPLLAEVKGEMPDIGEITVLILGGKKEKKEKCNLSWPHQAGAEGSSHSY